MRTKKFIGKREGKSQSVTDVNGEMIWKWFLKGMWFEDMDWWLMGVQWRTLVSAVMDIGVAWKGKNLLTSWETMNFTRRSLLHGTADVVHIVRIKEYGTRRT